MAEGRAQGAVVVERADLAELFRSLSAAGYGVVGPTIRDGAIVYDEIRGVEDLPEGWTDEQDAGRYRLHQRSDRRLFGYAVGPQSWKRQLQVPRLSLWKARREGRGFRVVETDAEPPRTAFFGVRSCELHAIAIQDRVLAGGAYVDADYAARRKRVFIVAVNCAEAGGTCFCVSMGTGPQVKSGYDLALTELLDDARHEFLIEIGSEAGAEILRSVPARDAAETDFTAARDLVASTAKHMGRELDTRGVRELLYRNLDHPRWDEVASRCLGCTNCTMVCPTCFCTTVEDVTDLAGEASERVRVWDSCYTTDHSHVHGGAIHPNIRSRYRQWLTHKLASWIDQFGTSGCVGCGRCITWCPVGIDLTEEVAAMRTPAAATVAEKEPHP
jgi:ferredoxin